MEVVPGDGILAMEARSLKVVARCRWSCDVLRGYRCGYSDDLQMTMKYSVMISERLGVILECFGLKIDGVVMPGR